jgi:hypothetical protein
MHGAWRLSWKVVQQKLTVCVWARRIIMRRRGGGRNTSYISVLYRKWDMKTALLMCYYSLLYLISIVCAFSRCCVVHVCVCVCVCTVCWVGYVEKIIEPTGIGNWYLSDKIMTQCVTGFKSTVYRILILRDACSNTAWKKKVILLSTRPFRDRALYQELNKQAIFF